MEVKTLTVGEMATNCYLLYNNQNNHTAIIDPGEDADFITDQIQSLKLLPQFIILTHGHFDHCLASLELSLNYQIPVFLNQKDNFLYQKASQSAKHFTHQNYFKTPPSKSPDKTLTDSYFQIISTPGHTPGSICLYQPPYLFTGDTLFADAVGRTDLSYSRPLDLQDSLEKIKQLPSETIILPGHGTSIYLSDTPIFE